VSRRFEPASLRSIAIDQFASSSWLLVRVNWTSRRNNTSLIFRRSSRVGAEGCDSRHPAQVIPFPKRRRRPQLFSFREEGLRAKRERCVLQVQLSAQVDRDRVNEIDEVGKCFVVSECRDHCMHHQCGAHAVKREALLYCD